MSPGFALCFLLPHLYHRLVILHANMEICCSFKSFAAGTCGLSYREDRSCISQVVPLHSCKKDISSHLRSCKFSDPSNEVDLILSHAGIFDDFAICPIKDVGWSRGSNTRCRVLKEVFGHFKR